MVYEVPCKDCSKAYIGETKRTLKVRRSEHEQTGQLANIDVVYVFYAYCQWRWRPGREISCIKRQFTCLIIVHTYMHMCQHAGDIYTYLVGTPLPKKVGFQLVITNIDA